MIGFDLLQDLKRPENKDKKDDLIAAALIRLEEKKTEKTFLTKTDLEHLATKVDIKDLEIKLINKTNLNSFIVGAVVVLASAANIYAQYKTTTGK